MLKSPHATSYTTNLGCGIWDVGRDVGVGCMAWEGCGMWGVGHGTCDVAHGMWGVGHVIQDLRCRIWYVGRGTWDAGWDAACGMWGIPRPASPILCRRGAEGGPMLHRNALSPISGLRPCLRQGWCKPDYEEVWSLVRVQEGSAIVEPQLQKQPSFRNSAEAETRGRRQTAARAAKNKSAERRCRVDLAAPLDMRSQSVPCSAFQKPWVAFLFCISKWIVLAILIVLAVQ